MPWMPMLRLLREYHYPLSRISFCDVGWILTLRTAGLMATSTFLITIYEMMIETRALLFLKQATLSLIYANMMFHTTLE